MQTDIGKLKLFGSSLPPAGAEGDGGSQKEPHDDMKKSSHTNKTDTRTGLLFMRHSEDIASSAAPQHSYVIYLLTVYQKHTFGSIALMRKPVVSMIF